MIESPPQENRRLTNDVSKAFLDLLRFPLIEIFLSSSSTKTCDYTNRSPPYNEIYEEIEPSWEAGSLNQSRRDVHVSGIWAKQKLDMVNEWKSRRRANGNGIGAPLNLRAYRSKHLPPRRMNWIWRQSGSNLTQRVLIDFLFAFDAEITRENRTLEQSDR